MAIFIVMFVTFTIAFANLSQSSSAFETDKQRLLSACRLFDAIKTQQRVKTSNISKGASLQFKDVWLRDPKD
jgi:ABC-type transport system involved in cytochrome bd biosynthesis fused ATPase/permease subunit